MDETDVLIIGGGPAGAAAALALARAGVRCTVLESQRTPPWKIGETLAPEARPILQDLGVWERFQADRHRSSPGLRSAWGGEVLAERSFIFNPHGSAWQLDRAAFETMLLDAAAAAGARVARGVTVQTVGREPGGWTVATSGHPVRAAWLLDASGRGSPIAGQLRVRREILDQLVSVHARTASPREGDTDARTTIESCADGWWYSALLPGGRRLFAFQTDAGLLPGQEWRAPGWFQRRLEQTRHIRTLAGPAGLALREPPRLTSARSSRLEACHGEGWVAAGDAARSFDPLSGEGLFHGLLTGRHAARCLALIASGAGSKLADYAAEGDLLWNRFRQDRERFYSAETRWIRESFWRVRQSGHATTAGLS